MQISEQYQSYEKTLLVVTNLQKVRIFTALGRKIKPLQEFEEDDYDDLLKKANEYLVEKLKKDDYQVVLTVPEILRGELMEKIDPLVAEKAGEPILKNLGALELDAIVRILQEEPKSTA